MATPITRHDNTNKHFLRSFITAITFLTISAAMLIAGFIAWHYEKISAQQSIQPISIYGKDLRLDIGEGKYDGNKLILTELKNTHAVIAAPRFFFNADKYPFIVYKINGRHPGIKVAAYWRTTSYNRETQFAPLSWNGDITTANRFETQKTWKNLVTEFGISVTGDLRNQPLTIEYIRLSPMTIATLLLTIWSEWNAFEGWSHHSINVIFGSIQDPMISPVVAAATWCGLAIFLYTFWIFLLHYRARTTSDSQQPCHSVLCFAKYWNIRTPFTILLISWMALDGKWQVNLWRQLRDTSYLFSGKNHVAQHMSADDAELYAYAMRLKEEILPETPSRLFILRNKWQDFKRLRMMYYLLPHNIYNFGALSSLSHVRDGDYILTLHPLNEISYHTSDNLLLLSKSQTIQADLLDQDPLGDVFKIRIGSGPP